ncbi:MAG: YihY/virulence factor BrkB family protein [Planctomycetota bacterium]
MFSRIWQLISETCRIWAGARSSEMAAALAYYAMLSVAPTLVIATAVAGWIYDEQLVEERIIEAVSQVTTPEISQVIADVIGRAQSPEQGIVAGAISICVLVVAASMVFTQMYSTFNIIWHVDQPKGGFWFNLRVRLAGIILVLSVGLVLIAALIMHSLAGHLSHLLENYPTVAGFITRTEQQLTFILMPFILSLMFWLFPATKLKLIDVIPAGFLTAFMVAGSRSLIQLYLKYSSGSEVYGAMGSLVIMLVWIYLLSMILFLGASFSCAWTHVFGSRRLERLAASEESSNATTAGEEVKDPENEKTAVSSTKKSKPSLDEDSKAVSDDEKSATANQTPEKDVL